jgi:outer membrane protein assembly factor BamB
MGTNNVRITWPYPTNACILQSAGEIAGVWTDVAGPFEAEGDRWVLNVTAADYTRFYRLKTSSGHAAPAPGWPQWRGPNRDAISPEMGLLKQWPETGPPLAWQANGLGAGYSSASIMAGRVFTMGGFTDNTRVIALNETSGLKLWSTPIGGPGTRSGHPGPRCTPTVDNENVFALTQQGDLACLETATGTAVWRKQLTGDYGGQLMAYEFGYCESPLVDGDKLVCIPGGPNGTLLALDKKTGQKIWQSSELADQAAFTSLIAAEIGGVRQYVVLTDASVAGVAAADGRLLWRAVRAGGLGTVPTPVCRDNHVYVLSTPGAGCNLYRITANDGRFSVRQIYANTAMLNDVGGVVLLGDYIYGYSERTGWVCQKFLTGEVVWTDNSFGRGSIIYADGCFYLRNPGGTSASIAATLCLVEPTAQGFRELGRFDQPQRSNKNAYPHPTIANGKLYLRDQDVLLCYDIKAR